MKTQPKTVKTPSQKLHERVAEACKKKTPRNNSLLLLERRVRGDSTWGAGITPTTAGESA